MAGAEEMDEAARGDGSGTPAAGLLEGFCLGLSKTLEERLGMADPGEHRDRACGGPHADITVGSRSMGSQCPLRIER